MSTFRFHQGYGQPEVPNEQKIRPIEHEEVIRVLEAQVELLAQAMGIHSQDLLHWLAERWEQRMKFNQIPF